MKTLSMAVAASVSLGTAAFAECGEIQIADLDWQTAQVSTSIAKFIMEQGYGCTVKTVPTSTTAALVSLSESGTPHILMDIWSNTSGALDGLRESGEIIFAGNLLQEGGLQGWWIPKYIVDENPELATLEGILANPDLVGGRFMSCPDGWTCKNTNGNMAKAADLEGAGIEVFVPGSGEALSTSLASAYSNKEPWLGYYWSPTPLLGKNEMVLVDVGEYDKAIFDCNTTPDCATPGVSPYPKDDVWNIITAGLAEREPEVAELIGKISMSNQTMSTVLAWQEENGASSDEAAVYFLTNYGDIWSTWLNDAAREKLSGLLQ